MSLSDLPTLYDLTPDYAGNLADLSPVQDMLKWALIVGGVGYLFYRTVNGSDLSGYAPRRRRRRKRR